MTKNLSKRREKWHDDTDASAGAKVWPALAAAEEEESGGNDSDGDGKGLAPHQLRNDFFTIGTAIPFAEALQNSSTLYGVSSLLER